MEEDAFVRPSDLGLFSSFPLVRSEGKIGDRVVVAFFEKRQQVIRLSGLYPRFRRRRYKRESSLSMSLLREQSW